MISTLLSTVKCKFLMYKFVNPIIYKFARFFTSLDLNGILYHDLTSFNFKISTATLRKNSRQVFKKLPIMHCLKNLKLKVKLTYMNPVKRKLNIIEADPFVKAFLRQQLLAQEKSKKHKNDYTWYRKKDQKLSKIC